MKQDLAKLMMKSVIKPARYHWFNPHRPVNRRETLIMRALKSCEMMKVRVAHTAKLFHTPQNVSRVLTNAATTLPSRLLNDDTPLRCATGEIGPVDFAKARRIVFPMPRFVLVGIPAEFLAAQEQPLVHG